MLGSVAILLKLIVCNRLEDKGKASMSLSEDGGSRQGPLRESLKGISPPRPSLPCSQVARVLTGLIFATCVAVVAMFCSGVQDPVNELESRDFSPVLPVETPSAPPDVTITPELEAYVNRLVVTALRDPVGRQDFALYQDGAAVINRLTSPNPNPSHRLQHAPPLRAAETSPAHDQHAPEAALHDDLRVGECWLVSGRSGQLGIGLHTFLAPTHVTIDHIPLEIAADIGQAPRKMVLWGLVEGDRNLAVYHDLVERGVALHTPGHEHPTVHSDQPFVLLASFAYDIFAPFHIQTFPISSIAVDEGIYFGVVVLEVLDNWGGQTTCVYRVRVHGNVVVL